MFIFYHFTGVGCQLESDTVWGLEWPFTASGSVAVQACPGLSGSKGEYILYTSGQLQLIAPCIFTVLYTSTGFYTVCKLK